jgi:hypothetical protein
MPGSNAPVPRPKDPDPQRVEDPLEVRLKVRLRARKPGADRLRVREDDLARPRQVDGS